MYVQHVIDMICPQGIPLLLLELLTQPLENHVESPSRLLAFYEQKLRLSVAILPYDG